MVFSIDDGNFVSKSRSLMLFGDLYYIHTVRELEMPIYRFKFYRGSSTKIPSMLVKNGAIRSLACLRNERPHREIDNAIFQTARYVGYRLIEPALFTFRT